MQSPTAAALAALGPRGRAASPSAQRKHSALARVLTALSLFTLDKCASPPTQHAPAAMALRCVESDCCAVEQIACTSLGKVAFLSEWHVAFSSPHALLLQSRQSHSRRAAAPATWAGLHASATSIARCDWICLDHAWCCCHCDGDGASGVAMLAMRRRPRSQHTGPAGTLSQTMLHPKT